MEVNSIAYERPVLFMSWLMISFGYKTTSWKVLLLFTIVVYYNQIHVIL